MADPQLEDGYTRIANEILERLVQMHLAPNQWQVLLCIIRKTYGWYKKTDRISLTQFHEISGMDRSSVVRAIRTLKEMNLITVKASQKGNVYGLNKDYHSWVVTKRSPPLVTKRSPKVVSKRSPTIDKIDTIIDKRQPTAVLKDIYKVKEEPFPMPTADQKEELANLAIKLNQRKFNVFIFIQRVKKAKEYFPPIAGIIKIAHTALKTQPNNLWGYFTKALQIEFPKAFAELNIAEHQQIKKDVTSIDNIMQQLYKGGE